MVALCTFKNLSRSWWINVRLLYSQHFLNSTANITQHSCFCVSLMTTYNWQLQLLIERILAEKGVFCHHVIHFVLLFSGPFYKITCYGGDRVHSGCAVQEILLCARDFQELTDSSQGFCRLLDYLHAWHINKAPWKSLPDHVASISQTKVTVYFYLEFFRLVYLWTQIN